MATSASRRLVLGTGETDPLGAAATDVMWTGSTPRRLSRSTLTARSASSSPSSVGGEQVVVEEVVPRTVAETLRLTSHTGPVKAVGLGNVL
jgi:hypothetical protein